MRARGIKKRFSTFQIIIAGFAGIILLGALLLMLPAASKSGSATSFESALFTATSAVCVTGLVVKDTSSYWSYFGQAVILILIQIGGLGVVTVAAFIEAAAGKKLSLGERNLLADSISAFQVGGVVKMMRFIIGFVFAMELIGAVLLMPVFCRDFGALGIWMSVFHSISAFCNAGFDLMGAHSGEFSSLTFYSGSFRLVIPVCFLIVFGGIGFLTWTDILTHRQHFKRYRLQSKTALVTTGVLILVPLILYFFLEFGNEAPGERFCLALFQSVTPRTAGFNTADLGKMSGTGITLMIVLMLIGGSPGSTAGGMKTTTLTVLLANALSVFRRNKETHLFGRRVEDSVVRSASALLLIYAALTLVTGALISLAEGLPLKECFFETASALGTAGLTLGITSTLGLFSHIILIILMFIGRTGGLTLMYAAIGRRTAEVSRYSAEKINVG